MTNNKAMLLCNCGWKKVCEIDKCEDLIEIKNDTLGKKKFRCPSCGFAITPTKTKDPQQEIENLRIEKKIEKENEKWLEESIEKQNKFIKEIENAKENND